MTRPPSSRKLDYSDYAAIPNDGKRYEILQGQLIVNPAPTPLHQRVSKRLQRQLEDYFEARSLGEVFDAPIDAILGPHDIVQPDLVVVARPEQISKRGIEGAPLIAIEVLSPSTRSLDRTRKGRRYLELGIVHYWIVDPDAHWIECFRAEDAWYVRVLRGEGATFVSHPDWPELEIDLAKLWR